MPRIIGKGRYGRSVYPVARHAPVIPPPDHKVAVTAADTVPDYLADKLVSGAPNVVLTLLNPGADEQLSLTVTSATPAAHAPTHRPNTGSDPLSTAAPTQGIGGSNAVGTGDSFARNDHDHTIRETSGPTNLTVGAIADGQFVRRSGAALIGASPTAAIYYDRSTAELTATGVAYERVLRQNAGAELGFDLSGWVAGSTLRARFSTGIFATANAPDVVFRIVLVLTSGDVFSTEQSAATFTTNAPTACVIDFDFPAVAIEATMQLRVEWKQVGAGTRAINPAAAIPTFAALSAWMIPP